MYELLSANLNLRRSVEFGWIGHAQCTYQGFSPGDGVRAEEGTLTFVFWHYQIACTSDMTCQ